MSDEFDPDDAIDAAESSAYEIADACLRLARCVVSDGLARSVFVHTDGDLYRVHVMKITAEEQPP